MLMTTRDGGKGDAPRPLGVSIEEFDKNFDAIFGKKEPVPFAGHIDLDIESTNDEQSVTVTKTWEI
jgi:hypothetical protein